jgi:hypothetical protein
VKAVEINADITRFDRTISARITQKTLRENPGRAVALDAPAIVTLAMILMEFLY